MENISWNGHKTNEYVLDLVKEKIQLLNIVLLKGKPIQSVIINSLSALNYQYKAFL